MGMESLPGDEENVLKSIVGLLQPVNIQRPTEFYALDELYSI